MGHAHHFLSRLDRVSLPHVELALSLYRDDTLLQYILGRSNLPKDVPRVALSLDDPTKGPFLIVTRDGKFVTCLAEGMLVSAETPVISRGQMDAVTNVFHNFRRQYNAVNGPHGSGVAKLLRRIYEAADEMSREEFIVLSALQPLYRREFMRLAIDAGLMLEKAWKTLIPILRKTDKPNSSYRDTLRTYWYTMWAMANLIALANADAAAGLDPALLEIMQQGTFTQLTVNQGMVAIALRGIWAAGNVGKPLLEGYEKRLRETGSQLENIETVASIVAIGIRHPHARAEALKILRAEAADKIKGTPVGTAVLAVRAYATKIIENEGESPGTHEQWMLRIGASSAVMMTQESQTGFHYKSVEDVPAELSRALMLNGNWCYFDNAANGGRNIGILLRLAAVVAQCGPEDLYYPAEVLRRVRVPWTPEFTLGVLYKLRDFIHRPGNHIRPDGPTRKGPCPCGSGKKYKRCCGEGKNDTED